MIDWKIEDYRCKADFISALKLRRKYLIHKIKNGDDIEVSTEELLRVEFILKK